MTKFVTETTTASDYLDALKRTGVIPSGAQLPLTLHLSEDEILVEYHFDDTEPVRARKPLALDAVR